IPQTFQGPKHQEDKGLERESAPHEHCATLTVAMYNTMEHTKRAEDAPALDVPKGWYLAADGSMIMPRAGERGKAATLPGDRRVAKGQFFQYQHLAAGQQWLVWIDADEPASEAKIADELAAAPLVLGR